MTARCKVSTFMMQKLVQKNCPKDFQRLVCCQCFTLKKKEKVIIGL